MAVLGLVLIVIGALLILGGVLGTGSESRTSDGQTDVFTTFIGIEMTATTLFLLGVVAAVLVLSGLWMTKLGAQHGWKRRKEQKRLTELSEKLDRVEAERNAENDPGER